MKIANLWFIANINLACSDLGNYVKCQTLFKKSIIKRIDDPARLIEVWNSIEYEMGNLESYEDALVRINSKTKMLTNEWHAQLVEQEEKEQRKISKELETKVCLNINPLQIELYVKSEYIEKEGITSYATETKAERKASCYCARRRKRRTRCR